MLLFVAAKGAAAKARPAKPPAKAAATKLIAAKPAETGKSASNAKPSKAAAAAKQPKLASLFAAAKANQSSEVWFGYFFLGIYYLSDAGIRCAVYIDV